MSFYALLLVAASAQTQIVECGDDMSQVEMNQCSLQAYRSTDAQLNTIWKRVADALKARDRRPQQKGFDKPPAYFNTLLEGQRGWLIYRDKQCASEGNQVHGGSVEPFIINSCKTKLTEARITQLNNLLEEY